jgi:transposase InsO family protein
MVKTRLAPRDVSISRDRLFGLLRENGLLVKRRRNGQRTTDSYHRFHVYKNLIKGHDFDGPHQAWVADITYLRTLRGFCYLSLITDLHSRKIVGYHLSRSLAVEGATAALVMALSQLPPGAMPIHHSDRGIQYCCHEYHKHQKSRCLISMTEKDHVYENAVAERVNGILKNELLLGEQFVSFNQAVTAVSEAVRIYNQERLHAALDYQTPAYQHAA